MLYYLSLDYSIVSDHDFENRPSGSLVFDEKTYHVIGRRITRPHYHKQIPSSKIKLVNAWKTEENKFRNHPVEIEQYEIPSDEFEKMEEKPPVVRIKKGNNSRGKSVFMDGWSELHYEDDSTTVLQYLIKDKAKKKETKNEQT